LKILEDHRRGARGGLRAAAHAANTGDDTPVAFSACYVQPGEQAVAASARVSRSADDVTLVVDSGASRHILCDAALFSIMQPATTSVQLANNSSATATAQGTAPFTVAGGNGGSIEIQLRDVLLLPGGVNLLSVSRLAEAGHQMVLGGSRPELRLKDGRVVPLVQRGGLFLLEAKSTALRLLRPPSLLLLLLICKWAMVHRRRPSLP